MLHRVAEIYMYFQSLPFAVGDSVQHERNMKCNKAAPIGMRTRGDVSGRLAVRDPAMKATPPSGSKSFSAMLSRSLSSTSVLAFELGEHRSDVAIKVSSATGSPS
jgi:hypothetical protein